MKQIFAAFAALLIAGCSVVKEHQEPEYTVTSQAGDIEIRSYKPSIIAQTTVSGPRDDANSKGFKILADYIFGNNTASEKMSMTVPVARQEKIEMTAPVTRQQTADGNHEVRFFMPPKYTMETLPKPNDSRVNIIQVPAYRAAVITFSGRSNEANFNEHLQELLKYMDKNNMTASQPPINAYYDDPLTPWFMRRNEVIIPIKG